MNDLLTLQKVTKRFGERTLFSDFSFSFPSKGLYAFLGASGSGKSTLLEMISGLDSSYEGTILYRGRPLTKQDEPSLSKYRLLEIGYIRQGYDLLELESALTNVSLPIVATSDERKENIVLRAKDLLSAFGLKKRIKSKVSTLSGGEKQRVALARAISSKTRILLADEPTGALDSKNASLVYRYLKKISETMLVLFVTHDEEAAFSYADGVLLLEHAKITFKKRKRKARTSGEKIVALPINSRKKLPSVPFLFWLKHAYHLTLTKKRRSALAMSILSLSLFSLGISIFLSFDANREIETAFSSLIGKSVVVMEKEGDLPSIQKAYAATYDDIESIRGFVPSLIEGYGVTYFADLRSSFRDMDMVYAIAGTRKVELSGFDANSPNDYLLLSETNDVFIYPSTPEVLEDDQLILGLPYKNMAQLCFGFQIMRDYLTLGAYLEENEVQILFEVANEAWNYEDSQIFNLAGVIESEKPVIYHTNPLWNQYFYETRMRFPTTDGSEYSYPWVMQKLYYLRSSFDDDDFYREVRLNPVFSRYLFERPTEEYNPSVCSFGEKCRLNRYYVYFVERNSFSLSLVEQIQKRYDFPSYLLLGENSYVSFPSSMMSGFAFPFYASSEIEPLSNLVESVSIVPIAAKDLPVKLPQRVKEGSYRLPFGSALTISSSHKNLIHGVFPKARDEVALSQKLYEEWEKPSTIYCAGMVNEKESGGYVERDYRLGALKVTGVIEDSNDVFYVSPSWSIDFFREELGMSSFLVEPTKVIFETEGQANDSLIAKMKADYPSLHFEDPSSSIATSTESVIYFVRLALTMASISSLSISFLLLVTISALAIRENKKEGRMLFELGISREDIVRAYFSISLLPIAFSTALALTLVSITEYFIHQKIAESFASGSLAFHFSFLPLLCVILASFLAGFFLFVGLKYYLSSRDFRKEGR